MTQPLPKPLVMGPRKAPFLIIGEAPNRLDLKQNRPFAGSVGKELFDLLSQNGVDTAKCRFTYALPVEDAPIKKDPSKFVSFSRKKPKPEEILFHDRPASPLVETFHAQLEQTIAETEPEVIIALGTVALWLLTGELSVSAWRGSMIDHPSGAMIVPTYAPGLLFRQAELRHVMARDVARAAHGRVPAPVERFRIYPTYDEVIAALRAARGPVAWDIETTAHQYIVCIGFAWSSHDALCIPLIHPDGSSWWTPEQEADLIGEIRAAATRCHNIGQNFAYDNQYFAHHYGFTVPIAHDTLSIQHLLFPGELKNLSYLSSMYLDYHRHWKDDEKDWTLEGTSRDEFFIYNCRDAVKTFSIAECQTQLLARIDLGEARKFHDISQNLAFEMMLRGVRIDHAARAKLALELGDIYAEQVEWLSSVCGQEINPRSDALMDFFYEDLGLPVQRNYKTGQPSLDVDSLEALATREPIVRPLVERILRARSVGVVKSTFIEARLDRDGRARSSYNASGTETFRWSSSKSVFGTGMNLQNIPRDAAFGSVRSMFVPDKGRYIADADLAGADAHVVAAIAAEYGDSSLLEEFNEGGDQHMKNARAIWGEGAGKAERQLAKIVVHASNYGASPKSVAVNTGISIAEAEDFQRIWFSCHPGIKRWHEDIWRQLQTTRTIYSKWGFRKVFFGRVDQEFKEALAWIPQHTVAIATNLVAHNIRKSGLPIEFLMQVHDSLVFQFPPAFDTRRLEPFLSIAVPYEPTLHLKMKMKISKTSWGECE